MVPCSNPKENDELNLEDSPEELDSTFDPQATSVENDNYSESSPADKLAEKLIAELDRVIAEHEEAERSRQAELDEMRETVFKALNELSERDRMILSVWLGLEPGDEHFRDRITRERIRQIQSKLAAKMRHRDKGSNLKNYLED